MPARGRKSTQRERIVTGMVAAANRDGYGRASVSAVIAQAGVSRPTFYEYFSDRDDCFLSALAEIQARLAGAVAAAIVQEPPERALHAAIGAIIAFTGEEPVQAHFLINEPMGAGARAHEARDRGIAEIELMVEEAHARAPRTAPVADLAVALMIGGVYRLLYSRLRRGEPSLAGLREDLSHWLEAYELPRERHRWRTLAAGPALPRSPHLPETPRRAPGPLPPGRPERTREEVAENHRQRILHAAAVLAERKGYNATTIADITRLAGVDGRVFYSSFTDKQDAFMTVHELGFQQVMNVTAHAFFSGASWPERIWEGGRAFVQFLENEPLITHVGFVEAHAVGPGAAQRVEDSHIAFTMFLQEGYRHQPSPEAAPSQVALEAIITTIFELVYHQARRSAEPQLSTLMGHVAFLAMAPFLGAVEANRFIDANLRGSHGRRRGGGCRGSGSIVSKAANH
ncbi:MAG: TetR/AcrR family transcriptional regulator [Solirubrobacteraceae bacterium]